MDRRARGEQATNVTSEVVGPERVGSILERHNRLWRADQITQGILGFGQGDVDSFRRIREIIGHHGGFIMKYTKDKIMDRLAQSAGRHWVVAEASAKLTTLQDGKPMTGDKLAWADCQCSLPADTAEAGLDEEINLPLPERGDHIFSKATVQKIEKMPACAGCVADLCAADEAAHMGLASAARRRAFDAILKLDRTIPIRYLTAEIFSIRGLILPDGTTIYPPVSITNFASILMHEHSRHYPAYLGWVLNERLVEVSLEDQSPANPYYLITDWFVMIYDFDFIRKLSRSPAGQ